MSSFSYKDQLFKAVANEDPVIVAVSGGSDSVALLHLAHIWSVKHGVELHAVTIDHGLRPEAAAEAAFVAGICAQLGIDHTTIAWDGVKPSFGLQEAARLSRYFLLENFAHEIGASDILTGHTRDDQSETVFMRALRSAPNGDGRGLAGMSEITRLYSGVRIVRPLLSATRQSLREMLNDVSQPWIEDPSNHDQSFERVRIRNQFGLNGKLSRQALLLSEQAGRLRQALGNSVANFLTDYVCHLPGPVFELKLPSSVFENRSNPVLEQALQVLIALGGGGEYLVSRRRLEKLLLLLSKTFEGKLERGTVMTLGGAIIQIKQDVCDDGQQGTIGQNIARLTFLRENRNLGSLIVEPGETVVWDGRLHLNNGSRWPIYVEPVSRQLLKVLEQERGGQFAVKPRRALLSSPVLHIQSEEADTVPILPLVESGALPRDVEVRMVCLAIEHFCPQWDTGLLNWIKSLDSYASASLQP